jgi:hypothetical protein
MVNAFYVTRLLLLLVLLLVLRLVLRLVLLVLVRCLVLVRWGTSTRRCRWTLRVLRTGAVHFDGRCWNVCRWVGIGIGEQELILLLTK